MSDNIFEADPLEVLAHWRSRLNAAVALLRAAQRESDLQETVRRKVSIAVGQIDLVVRQLEHAIRSNQHPEAE